MRPTAQTTLEAPRGPEEAGRIGAADDNATTLGVRRSVCLRLQSLGRRGRFQCASADADVDVDLVAGRHKSADVENRWPEFSLQFQLERKNARRCSAQSRTEPSSVSLLIRFTQRPSNDNFAASITVLMRRTKKNVKSTEEN